MTRRAMFATVLAVAMVSMAAGPAAQTDEEFDKIFPFLGAMGSERRKS